ncbi:MAG: MATE family efflux transporter [Treponemataceae bacterium]|nr:MATE family efflux transporter [Treponemataceae bacterium]
MLFKTEYKNKLVKIFVPIMLSNLISQIQMFIDRIFLGRMDILYMSAVGNATAPVWTTMSFVFSLSMGASILISQAVGEKNIEKAKQYAASMVKFHNVIPVLLFLFWMFCSPLVFTLMGVSPTVMDLCVTYTRIYSPVFLIIGLGASYSVVFQTSNYTKPLVTYGIIRSVLNIILDYLLIFGKFGFPRMEIAGAALGTTIAEYVGAFYMLYVTIAKRKKFFTSPGLKQILHAEIMPYLRSIKLGVNTALEDLLWNAGNLCIIRILNTISETAAGIYSMVFTVEVIFVVIIGSIGSGTLTLTGEATGAKDFKLYRNIVKTSIKWSFLVAAFALIFISIFPRLTLSLFTTDEAVIEMSVIYIILVAVNLFGKSGNIIVGNGIRGYGNTKWMLFTQIFGTVMVVGLAALFVFVFKLGIIGVFVAVLCDEAIRAVINFIRFLRIKF